MLTVRRLIRQANYKLLSIIEALLPPLSVSVKPVLAAIQKDRPLCHHNHVTRGYVPTGSYIRLFLCRIDDASYHRLFPQSYQSSGFALRSLIQGRFLLLKIGSTLDQLFKVSKSPDRRSAVYYIMVHQGSKIEYFPYFDLIIYHPGLLND
jgi:hypothetical protein